MKSKHQNDGCNYCGNWPISLSRGGRQDGKAHKTSRRSVWSSVNSLVYSAAPIYTDEMWSAHTLVRFWPQSLQWFRMHRLWWNTHCLYPIVQWLVQTICNNSNWVGHIWGVALIHDVSAHSFIERSNTKCTLSAGEFFQSSLVMVIRAIGG